MTTAKTSSTTPAQPPEISGPSAPPSTMSTMTLRRLCRATTARAMFIVFRRSILSPGTRCRYQSSAASSQASSPTNEVLAKRKSTSGNFHLCLKNLKVFFFKALPRPVLDREATRGGPEQHLVDLQCFFGACTTVGFLLPLAIGTG